MKYYATYDGLGDYLISTDVDDHANNYHEFFTFTAAKSYIRKQMEAEIGELKHSLKILKGLKKDDL